MDKIILKIELIKIEEHKEDLNKFTIFIDENN